MNQEICINTLFALSFITFMIMNLMNSNKQKDAHLNKIFTRRQWNIYQHIVKERTIIFFISFVISLAFVLFFIKNKWTATTVCFTLICALYELAPKSTYMIEHLYTHEQIKAWKQYNRDMQVRSAFATFCGVMSIPFICNLKNQK